VSTQIEMLPSERVATWFTHLGMLLRATVPALLLSLLSRS